MTSLVVEEPVGNKGVGGVPIDSPEDNDDDDEILLTEDWATLWPLVKRLAVGVTADQDCL